MNEKCQKCGAAREKAEAERDEARAACAAKEASQ